MPGTSPSGAELFSGPISESAQGRLAPKRSNAKRTATGRLRKQPARSEIGRDVGRIWLWLNFGLR
jgi:hypothetical protein